MTNSRRPRKPTADDSPTRKTLFILKREGHLQAVVEHFNPHARVRQDLFGFIDVLALNAAGTTAIQACARGDMSTRRNKILKHHNLRAVINANWRVELWGWKGKECKIEVIEIDGEPKSSLDRIVIID